MFAHGYVKRKIEAVILVIEKSGPVLKKTKLYLGEGKLSIVLWYSVCPMPMRLSRKVIEGASMGSSGLAAVIWVPALLYASAAAVGDLGAPLVLTS
jgi:hypothetical protein